VPLGLPRTYRRPPERAGRYHWLAPAAPMASTLSTPVCSRNQSSHLGMADIYAKAKSLPTLTRYPDSARRPSSRAARLSIDRHHRWRHTGQRISMQGRNTRYSAITQIRTSADRRTRPCAYRHIDRPVRHDTGRLPCRLIRLPTIERISHAIS